MDTHFPVTEHSAVNLKGKFSRERAPGMMSITDPKFRDEWLREAEDMYLIQIGYAYWQNL